MPRIDFSQFPYFPDLLASTSEHLGYGHLSDADKDGLTPIFTLSRRPNAANLAEAVALIRRSSGPRPFLLDLDHRPASPPYEARDPADPAAEARRVAAERVAQEQYNALLAELLSPTDGFVRWREFASQFPNSVPVLQYSDLAADARHVLRQAALLGRGGNSIALRIKAGAANAASSLVSQIISILEAPEQLLVILDCGQGRIHVRDRADFARRLIRSILAELDIGQQSQLQAVCMSNSMTAPTHDLMRELSNLDWRIWRSAREEFRFAFGDYAATPRPGAHSSFIPRDWRATVTYPLDEAWLIYRSPNTADPDGWIEGAREIRDHASFEPVPNAWGATIIRTAADGDIRGVDSSRFWNAAKVNLHLHRQLAYSRAQMDSGDEGDE